MLPAAKVDRWVEGAASYIIEAYRHEVADLIETTVAKWDADEAAQRIELQVGRDLQFIRINGTWSEASPVSPSIPSASSSVEARTFHSAAKPPIRCGGAARRPNINPLVAAVHLANADVLLEVAVQVDDAALLAGDREVGEAGLVQTALRMLQVADVLVDHETEHGLVRRSS